MNRDASFGDIIVRSYAIASRLEGEGQYNVAKLLRAAADSRIRAASHAIEPLLSRDDLSHEVAGLAGELSDFDLDSSLLRALDAGASAMDEGRLAMIDEAPHPFVCRDCGHVEMEFPTRICPVCRARPRTFQRFLPIYWLEAMDPFEAMSYLRRTPEEVKDLIEEVGDENLEKPSSQNGWSVRNVLSHLRDAQGVLDYRVNRLLEEDFPIIQSQAVFKWAQEEAERPSNTKEIYETYIVSRLKTLETLESISLRDWWREGRHEEFGVVSIQHQVSYFATHELTHLSQLEGLRDSFAPT